MYRLQPGYGRRDRAGLQQEDELLAPEPLEPVASTDCRRPGGGDPAEDLVAFRMGPSTSALDAPR
jgi:hypothetical protein